MNKTDLNTKAKMIVEYEEMFENSDKSKDDESEIKMNATDGNTKAKMKKTCGKT